MKQATKVLILIAVSCLVRPSFIPTAKGEDCVLKCMDRSQLNTGQSHDLKWQLCQIQCKGQTSEPTYGAIAYSRKDKLWGFTYNQTEKATAEKLALQYCVKQGGAKCQIEASFHNTCGAIAAGGDIVTWGIAGSRTTAQQYAEIACSRAGGTKCEAQASVCSSPDSSGASDLKSASVLPPGPDGKSAPLPPRKVSWGAIAYSSKDMGAGWSQGKDDRASAEKEAMAVCAQRGKGCVVQTVFNKQCGALAADRDFTGWATSADQREALQKAIDECKKAGGTRCVPHISFCSF